jgi:hypothetical protein
MTGTEWQEWLDGLPEAERDAEWCIQDCIRDYAASEAAAEARIKALEEALRELVDAEWMVSHDWGGDRESVLSKARALLRGDEGGKGRPRCSVCGEEYRSISQPNVSIEHVNGMSGTQIVHWRDGKECGVFVGGKA